MKIDKELYERYMKKQKEFFECRASGKFATMPKAARIRAVLKQFPFSETAEIKAQTNLSQNTIKKWYQENGITEYCIPLFREEKLLLECLGLYSVSAEEIEELSGYELWLRINRSVSIRRNIKPVLEYIYYIAKQTNRD